MGYGKTNEMAQILCFFRKRKIFKKTSEEHANHDFKILWLVVKEEHCRRFFFPTSKCSFLTRELKQPRRRRQQERHKSEIFDNEKQ